MNPPEETTGSLAEAGKVYFVSSETAKRLLTWSEVRACLAEAYAEETPSAATPPRTVARLDRIWLRTLPAIPVGGRYFGAKLMGGSFAPAPGIRPAVQYVIVLFDRLTSRIAAFVDADLITAYRTAGTSAVALDKLASPAPIRLAVLGSGLEATMHTRAFASLRPIERTTVFSPTPARREAFASTINAELGIPVEPVDTPQAAVAGASVVLAAARSRGEVPILYGDWLSPGAVIISIGSTVPEQREIDISVAERCDLIVCDVPHEVLNETGDMIAAAHAGLAVAEKSISLTALLRGDSQDKVASAKMPMFKSVGSGFQDVVVAAHLFAKARAAGLATLLPMTFAIKF